MEIENPEETIVNVLPYKEPFKEKLKRLWKSFLQTFKETTGDVELQAQNTFNPFHGYHPKGEGEVGMVKELLNKIDEAKKL